MNAAKVAIVIPPVWTGVYLNTARLLKCSLEDLEYKVSVKEAGEKLEVDFSIVLGWNLIPDSIKFHRPYILYQLEPLVLPHWQEKLQEKKDLFKEAAGIWDYSEANQEYLQPLGVQALVVIMRYHPKICDVVPGEYRDYDILFTGFLTDRRKRVLEDLQKHCLVSYQPRWGRDFLDALERSKILLNIHQYDHPTPVEQPRLSYAINNESLVISEASIDQPYRSLLTCEYDMITNTVLEFLHQPEEQKRTRDHCSNEFRTQNMTDTLKTALQPFFENQMN